MPEAIRNQTIGDFIAHRTRLSFHCDGPCVGLREVDLHVLGAAVALTRVAYPATGEFSDPEVLLQVCEVDLGAQARSGSASPA
jgi:hypothetical protein